MRSIPVLLALMAGSCLTSCHRECNEKTCPDGCCADGACNEGQAAAFCGLKGVACVDCTSTNQQCAIETGVCEDGPACGCSESACCGSGGICYEGDHDNSCGRNGSPCQDCTASNKTCQLSTGRCVSMDAGRPSCKTQGQSCINSSDCCSSAPVCEGGLCALCHGYFSMCSDDGPCCGSYQCLANGRCGTCEQYPSSCSGDADCCRGNCHYDSTYRDNVCN